MVGDISGIGHSSAKRLKELGIVSVSDLQQADSSVLEEEFGHATMETMKKLCSGIDESPVISFGLPQVCAFSKLNIKFWWLGLRVAFPFQFISPSAVTLQFLLIVWVYSLQKQRSHFIKVTGVNKIMSNIVNHFAH